MQTTMSTNGLKRQLENWSHIKWKKVNKLVKNLRQRIFRAKKLGNFKTLRSLQKLMQRSYANLLISVRRITQTNKGKATAGIDKEIINTPEQRVILVNGWKGGNLKPTRRVEIPKPNGKKWTFCATIADRQGNNQDLILYPIAYTPIERHVKVKGNASPDDPSLTEYWEKRHQKYGKSYWERNSRNYKIAQNQNWKCPICGEPLFNEEELDTHHIVPVAQGGDNSVENLQHLHRACHIQEHTKAKFIA